MPAPPDDLYDRIREDIASERGARAWLRARPTSTRAVLLGAVAFGSVVTLVASMRLEAFFEPRSLGWVLGLVAAITMAAVAMAALLRPVHADAWSPARRRLVAAAIALGSLGAITLAGDGTLGGLGTGRCLIVGGVAGLPTFVAATLLDRHPRRGVLFAALSATLTGALSVQLLCGAPGLIHLVTEHFGVVACFGVAYALLGLALSRSSRSTRTASRPRG